MAGNEMRAADQHQTAVDSAGDTLARRLHHLGRDRQRQTLAARLGDDGLGDDVLRRLVERGGDAQHFVGRHALGRMDGHDLRLAVGQRAGLVEHDGADPRQRLDRLTALDQDAELGGARQAGNNRHRHRQDQRTGRRHHQHGHRPHRIAGQQPGRGGEYHRHRQEDNGVAVCQPRHRGARALGGLDQADDAGVGTLRGQPFGPEIEGIADIGRSAQHRVAGPQLHRQRFARERRLVEYRYAFDHAAVHRHHVTLTDQQPVARHDEIERYLLKPAVSMPHGGARHPRQQGGHLSPGCPLGIALQVLPAGIHQRHDGGGEVLADQQRPRHRQRGDDIEPEIAAAQAGDDLRQEHQQHRHGDRGPDCRRPDAKPV